MADTAQYMLSFNMEEVLSQISDLQDSYVNLGSELGKFTSKSSESIDALEQRLKKVTANLDASLLKFDGFFSNFQKRMKETETVMQTLSKSSKEFLTNLNSLGTAGVAALEMKGGQAPNPSKVAEVAAGGPERMDELKKAHVTAEATNQAAKDAISNSKKAEQEGKSAAKKIGEAIESEAKNAKSKIGGLFSGFTGGALAGGGLMAGIGLMVLATQEKQRKGAERGEMANAFEAMGANATKDGQKAIGWFSKFQERAQWKWGVGRQEIQGVASQLSQSGMKEFLDSNFNKPLGDVRANALSATLALDKHLNKASGSSMKDTIGLVEEYGYSLDKASDSYIKLTMEAQRSGMSIEKFVGSVMAGSSSLKQYGVELGDVTETMRRLKKHYEDMGMSSQQAGSFAAQGVSDIANTVGNMNQALFGKIVMNIMEEETGTRPDYFDAVQYARERQINLLKEGSEREKSNWYAKILLGLDKEIGQVDRSKWLAMFRQLAPGGGPMAAENAYAMIQSIKEKGMDSALDELSEDQMKNFNNTWKTEGQKLTELQKNQRDLIDGMAKIGEGLMTIASGILGILIIGIRSIPSIFMAAAKLISSGGTNWTPLFQVGEKINIAVSQQFTNMSAGLTKLDEGWEQTKKALGDTVDILFGNTISQAYNADLGKYSWSGIGKAISDLANSDAHQNALITELTNRVADVGAFLVGGWAQDLGAPTWLSPGIYLASVIRDKNKIASEQSQAELDRDSYAKQVRAEADAAIDKAKKGEKTDFGEKPQLLMYKDEIDKAYNTAVETAVDPRLMKKGMAAGDGLE